MKLATKAQNFIKDVPIAPIPTFTMDEFTFRSDQLGWIESNIKGVAERLMEYRDSDLILWKQWTQLYITNKHSQHICTKANSAYSAAVQLYARSNQLPVSHTLFKRDRLEDDAWWNTD